MMDTGIFFEVADDHAVADAVSVYEAAFYEWDGPKDREKTAERWRQTLVEKRDALLTVSRLDGKVVGFNLGWAADEPGTYFISLVGGLPEVRGKGIGRGLFRFTLDEIRRRGYAKVDINTLNRYRAMLILCVTEDFDIVDLRYDEGRKCKRIFLRRVFAPHERP